MVSISLTDIFFFIQTRIGRLLYWGSHGLKRNLADAMEYFKMSAETGDAQSQYDYGIVLIRVRWIFMCFHLNK